jgi:hypothetical protein
MTLSDDYLSNKSDIGSHDINDNYNFTTISNDKNNNVVNDKNHNNRISASNTKIKTKNFRFNEDEFINEYLYVATRNELSSDDHILLWWKSNDFRRFKIEAINEIKDIVKIQPHFNVKQAMSAMYQSKSQELIDNTCRNSRRFITLQQQINEKSHKNNNKCNNTNNNIRKDDDNNDKNNNIKDEDCVIQIRSRFLCSRKHFQCSKKQEDNVVVPNNNVITPYHTNDKIEAASKNNNINNKNSHVYNYNQDDNVNHNVNDNIHDHDSYCDEKNRTIVYDDTNKLALVLKTYSQRSRNYHFILTAYLILWLCAVWGIVFHQVITFYKHQKQQK